MSNIGYHVKRPVIENIENIWETQKTKSKVFQIFVANPTEFHMFYKEERDKKRLINFIKKHKLKIVAHGRYLDQPFNSTNKGLFTYMRHEFRTCVELGVYGFVIHLNATEPQRVLEVLRMLDPPKKLTIVLENSAMKPRPNVIQYNKASELVSLYKMVSKFVNISICIDTCHLWASGADIANPKTMKKFLDTLLKVIPKNKLLVHLNDSRDTRGSGRDRHEYVCRGQIWGPTSPYGDESLRILLGKRINTIVERWGEHEVDFNCIKKMGFTAGKPIIRYVVKV